MNENKDESEEIIRNVEDEKSEIIDKMIAEIENEVPEREESVDHFSLPKKVKKHTKAKLLVKKSKKIVGEANERRAACKLILETGLKKYEDTKSELKSGGYDACVSLVGKLGSKISNDGPFEETTVHIEAKEEPKPLVIKEVSSGKFMGLIYALIVGFFTAVGLVYLATEKLEMTLNVTRVPSEDIVQSILAWFSTTIGIQEDVYIGAGVFAFAVLLVMTLIYIVYTRMKANSNLHFAVKQFVEAELYADKKNNCNVVEIDKVDAHIKDTIDTLKIYEILLNEQSGKLQRILYIEGEKEKSTEYRDKSYLEIRETKELIHAIRDFLRIPMFEDGKLSSKSILFLLSAKGKVDKMLDRYYL